MNNFAGRIDHTNLKPEASAGEISALASEAMEHNFASVCVHGLFTKQVAQTLADSQVKTCVVAGFPMGANKPTIKAIESVAAVKDGADEIDFVAHLPNLLEQNLGAAKTEFLEIVRAIRTVRGDVLVKVIIESAVLMAGVSDDLAEGRIAIACQAARESGCDFIKTSSGLHPAGGASVEAVALMKKHSGGLYVKAAGGIRTRDDAVRMIEAGADRIGCSASVKLVTG